MNIAGDLLENDGRKFLEIMGRLTERRDVLGLVNDRGFDLSEEGDIDNADFNSEIWEEENEVDLDDDEYDEDDGYEEEEEVIEEQIESDDSMDSIDVRTLFSSPYSSIKISPQ